MKPNGIVFLDTEISPEDGAVLDIGALKEDGSLYHGASVQELRLFFAGSAFLCGHNILRHDLMHLPVPAENSSDSKISFRGVIDTLFFSPLLFPKRPYHALLKDDKLQTDEKNNPVNDCRKARDLFYDEVNAFRALPENRQRIFRNLLQPLPEFSGFFGYLAEGADRRKQKPLSPESLRKLIAKEYRDSICAHAPLESLILQQPAALSYALALIGTGDPCSLTPPWLLKTLPETENAVSLLRNRPCPEGCHYCSSRLDPVRALRQHFGYESFRTYAGEPLQEQAVRAAVKGESLLAVFPTGGGKSLTFQLPALMAGEAAHALTVVISPLQSLMKDQVDSLNAQGIAEAVTVNGMLDPIERANAFERVQNGSANLLYIAPEQLRSRTVEKLLLSRNIARFVIDEAHCFSAWGQDFRVDYLYIGDFISELQNKKSGSTHIPVSCFTATAKQKVISDIRDYFQKKLGLDLLLFASSSTRENLHYTVLYKETDDDKYLALRSLLEQKACPSIVYVSRTRRTRQLADKLCRDGISARPFNGRMDASEKAENQEAFLRNEVRVMVATSAFGMGVDKRDVGLVVHYDISASLEDYVQEAGRAGRDPEMTADCYVLYSDADLDKHFILLNQTRLSLSEIQQVWKAIRELTRLRPTVCCSPLEIARQAGWDDTVSDMETRVKTAVSALETAGYVRRGQNMPHVYATGILAENMQEAAFRIDRSSLFNDTQRTQAKRIIKSLLSSRSIASAGNDDAESRVDYLADTLGMTKEEVIGAITLMRQDGLLADTKDMSAFLFQSDSRNRSREILDRHTALESFLLSRLGDEVTELNLRELNEAAEIEGIPSGIRQLRTLLNFHAAKNNIRKREDRQRGTVTVMPLVKPEKLRTRFQQRADLAVFIVDTLFSEAQEDREALEEQELSEKAIPEKKPGSHSGKKADRGMTPVQFSVNSLFEGYTSVPRFDLFPDPVTPADVEDALLYLSKTGAMRLEGGFLVLYNGMELHRTVSDPRIRYKAEDYSLLDEFYKQKIRQIHIVGEYANLMVRDYDAALRFVQDYFQMDFRDFLATYFQGKRAKEIERNITPEKYRELFGTLSRRQLSIIRDDSSRIIAVAAGPGSGKTRVLVHKLASLLLLEDVKHEQLLMLTFSRAAATEFKTRLRALIGNAVNFIEIRTFHSFCFSLLGRVGSLDASDCVLKETVELIQRGEAEPGRIARTVLVIDEAQDMDETEYDLIQVLMKENPTMRVIAVGDDDQNIFSFRGSDAKYLRMLSEMRGAAYYEMPENYRSARSIVSLSEAFAETISNRLKSGPISAVRQDGGTVLITDHCCGHFEPALVRQLYSIREGAAELPHAGVSLGKTCVLTVTNEEALCVLGLLYRQGIPARLIQSLDGFRLSALAEVRFFLRCIDRSLKGPAIPQDLWERAKEKLFSAYSESSCLDTCRRLIRSFEELCPARYRTDLDDYLSESRYEDFYEDGQDAVTVSTIHKAKGREFDSVFLLLQGTCAATDEEKRMLYVGMTRARNNLFIHCNRPIFSSYRLPEVQKIRDPALCPESDELILQLGHRDVNLGYFRNKKEFILSLRSGMPLSFDGEYLLAELHGRQRRVLKFSKAFSEQLAGLREKGFEPVSAQIRFIVAWKGEDDVQESAVILPDLYLKR